MFASVTIILMRIVSIRVMLSKTVSFVLQKKKCLLNEQYDCKTCFEETKIWLTWYLYALCCRYLNVIVRLNVRNGENECSSKCLVENGCLQALDYCLLALCFKNTKC